MYEIASFNLGHQCRTAISEKEKTKSMRLIVIPAIALTDFSSSIAGKGNRGKKSGVFMK